MGDTQPEPHDDEPHTRVGQVAPMAALRPGSTDG